MNSEMEQIGARLERLENDNTYLKTQFQRAQRRMRVQAALAVATIAGAIFVSPANRTAIAQGYGVTLATLDARLKVVESKTQFQFADSMAKSTTFSGCNVVVNDGGGTTDTSVQNAVGAGLGNLIIGYNETGHNPDIRTGSHNLIIGDQQNYSSYGGLIAGAHNTISGPYTSVSGGAGNTASEFYASVSGGIQNTASAEYASVSGGSHNIASGEYASVSGGAINTASGYYASISGGRALQQSASYGWSGGSYYTP